METKDDILLEICDSLGIRKYQTTVGSSIPRGFFSDLMTFFELSDEGDAVTTCKSFLAQVGLPWEKEFSSESTPSGGGGTITLLGLKALRRAVSLILDEVEAQTDEIARAHVDRQTNNEWTLLRGQRILRKRLHDIFGGIRQGGISPSNQTNNVFLFSDDAANHEHGYERDFWEDDETFIYCGDGQVGDQTLGGRNGTILNHLVQGRKLRLFNPVAGVVTYLGELQIDTNRPFTFERGTGRDGVQRDVVMFRLKRLRSEFDSQLVRINSSPTTNFGKSYGFADETNAGDLGTILFEKDPNLVDRALRLHGVTQNTFARWVSEDGLTPLSPDGETCDFDLAWVSDYGRVVCEVKSINSENEVHQFRLGLGQVLEYANSLSATPLLVFSEQPKRHDLLQVAHKAGVRVLWPDIIAKYSPRDVRNIRHD